jgi:farnesyl-diphosphate farnesyltransferase
VHLDEVWAAITLLYLKPLRSNLDTDYIQKTFPSAELEFCDEILGKVSRSFAAVIRQLPSQLLVDVLIFYLILRALDTIEDDTTAFPSHAVKVEHLQDFYKNALIDPKWSLDGVGEADEKRLLQEFPKCQLIFSKLSPESRAVIADITERMANGMAEYVGQGYGVRVLPMSRNTIVIVTLLQASSEKD